MICNYLPFNRLYFCSVCIFFCYAKAFDFNLVPIVYLSTALFVLAVEVKSPKISYLML